VWDDADADGLQGPSEPGLVGVEVALLNATGQQVLALATTAGGGYYTFTSVSSGTYVVSFTLPLNGLFTIHEAAGGGQPALDSNPDPATGATAPFALAAGEANLSIDAGIRLLTGRLFFPSVFR